MDKRWQRARLEFLGTEPRGTHHRAFIRFVGGAIAGLVLWAVLFSLMAVLP